MTALVDTSVLIDYLRGHEGAAAVLERERAAASLQASEVSRLEVLAGMRPSEEDATRSLLATLAWHPVDAEVAEDAGSLGRRWLPSHHTIDGADLAIAAHGHPHRLSSAHAQRSALSDVPRPTGAVLSLITPIRVKGRPVGDPHVTHDER